METRPEILENRLFEALAMVDHKAEDDIYVWSQGMAFHYHNLLQSLQEKTTPAEQQAVLTDVWQFLDDNADPRVRQTLGLDKDHDLDRLRDLTGAILGDRDHPAIFGMGDSAEEAILNWVRAFTLLDFAAYTYLERHLGSKRCMEIYMGLWETFALANVDHVKAAVGVEGPEDIDMDAIGKISQTYWEAIATPYRVTRHSETVHEGEILICPYFVNMEDMLGTEKSRSMTLKCEAVVSVNYYDAVLKALGVFDRYSFTMDKFMCCGDDVCRVRFETRG